MDIVFPLSGLNTNYPRDAQPPGTSPDMLNVVPFDRDYRGRGALRSGISKFIDTQIGNGSQPVLLVEQVTRALDPSTIQPDTQLLDEAFAYSDGALETESDGTWVEKGTFSVFSGSTTTNAQIASGVVTGDGYTARYTPTLTLGPSYVIKMTCKISDFSHAWDLAIAFRSNTSSLSDGVMLKVSRSASNASLVFCSFNTQTAYGSSVSLVGGTDIIADTAFILELHVNGNKCFGYIDGVQKLGPISITDFSSNSIFGFMVSSSTATCTVDNFQVFAGSPLAEYRETDIVAVCGGNIYQGDTDSLAEASSGSGVLSETIKPQMAQRAGICYFVDSVHDLQMLTLSTKTVSTLSVSTGTETATTLGTCALATVWRDRLVVAAPVGTPQNFFMSRQGDPTDWDYSQTDAAAAVAGNASDEGSIGQPLNCLIPWTEDVLILGGDHNMYKVEGDLASGGQILIMTDAVGTLGPDCWDSDPSGNIYFVGTGGLFRIGPDGISENLATESVRKTFSNIDRTTTFVTCTWDRDRNGLWIHLTPVNSGTATHMFWDASKNGFFPIQYPNTVGPLTARVFDGDSPDDRQLLLASRDGYIRKADPSVVDDDGTDIASHVYIGPFRPAGDAALSVLEALEVMLGDAPSGFTESDFGVDLDVIVAKDAYTALNSPEKTVSFSFTKQSRRKRLLQRISGGTFFFKLSGVSGKLWSLEKLVGLFIEGGLQRRY